MSDRWGEIHRQATLARAGVATCTTGYVRAQAAIRARDLLLFSYAPDHPMLHGAKGVFDGDYIAFDRTLAALQAAWVLAHELGHAVLHSAQCQCSDADIDEAPVIARLPYGAAAIDTYNPRQRRELEANMFAAAFLLPPEEIRNQFLGGASFEAIAARFGVSPTATLNALAAVLLQQAPGVPAAAPTEPEPVSLDPFQQAAVEAPTGPVLVNAGPGTGKTRTLVGRIEHLLQQGVSPANVLALTFSNRAAGEMRDRVARSVLASTQSWNISTFHGFCLEILRQYHHALELPADFAVVDEIDLAVLLERHLAELPIDQERHLRHPRFFLANVVKAISAAKDELVDASRYAELAREAAAVTPTPEDPERKRLAQWAEVARVYPVYERLLRDYGFVDFGGLVMHVVTLLQRQPEILASLRKQYRHILVDEYQDMNRASAALLQLLAGGGSGLWVVGDIRQAIYRFRGAAPANIGNFPVDFPGARILDLKRNYRSDPSLVAFSQAVAMSMDDHGLDTPQWETDRLPLPGPRLSVGVAGDGEAEARGIAEEIRRRCPSNVGLRDHAVLVRTHAQARMLVEALARTNIPALYVGDLFARPEIRSLLALISLVVEGSGTGLMRVGDMDAHALPRDDRARLIRFAQSRNVRFPDALQFAPEAGLSCHEAVEVALGLHHTLGEIGWQISPWQFLARYLFGDGSLVRGLHHDGSAAAIQQLLAIGQLLHVARAFAERPVVKGLGPEKLLMGFLDHVRRLVAHDSRVSHTLPGEHDIDAVRVLTVHAAKGLEFPIVYITNLAAQRFPLQERHTGIPPVLGMAQHRADARGDESSLFFVAASRAQDELILTRAERYGEQRRQASPFLQRLEAHLAATSVVMRSWPADERPAPPDDGHHHATGARSLDMSAVERYQRCPRRYEYEHILNLPDRREILQHQRFRRCVTRTIAWIQSKQQAGAIPDEAAVAQWFREEWERSGEESYLFERVYAEAGAIIFSNVTERLRAGTPAQPWQQELRVDLAGSSVRVPLDLALIDANGTVRVSCMHLTPPSDKDRKEHRVALIREGMRQVLGNEADMVLELLYPLDGTSQELTYNKRVEPTRIDALTQAVAGIVAGSFPPKVGEACATCPYWMVCPA